MPHGYVRHHAGLGLELHGPPPNVVAPGALGAGADPRALPGRRPRGCPSHRALPGGPRLILAEANAPTAWIYAESRFFITGPCRPVASVLRLRAPDPRQGHHYYVRGGFYTPRLPDWADIVCRLFPVPRRHLLRVV